MNLLSGLKYSPFNNFCIRVEKIQYGWMYLQISTDEKAIDYAASYLSNPLDDLLAATIYIITEENEYLNFHSVNQEGKYLYVFHDLEPSLVTWLLKGDAENLTLLIWEEIPDDFQRLVEEGFDGQSVNVKMLNNAPDLLKDLAFSIQDSTLLFAKTLIKTFAELDTLAKLNDINKETDYPEWGYNYSVLNLSILKEWVTQKEAGHKIKR